MTGCRAFDELMAAKGMDILIFPKQRSYGCFAVDLPSEMMNLFVFVQVGLLDEKDKRVRGFASLNTYLDGVKINGGYADFEWRQYPQDHTAIWSDGDWLADGKTELMSFNPDATMKPIPNSDVEMRLRQLPQLIVSIDTENVQLTLKVNNDKHAEEKLTFNRFTGRARMSLDDSGGWRCVEVK